MGPSEESPRGRGDREEGPRPFDPDPGPSFQNVKKEMRKVKVEGKEMKKEKTTMKCVMRVR